MAVQREVSKELGIHDKKNPTNKKRGGSSRGGQINKKTKASFELGGANVKSAEEGKGFSTTAAKDLQIKSKEK